jgi:F0F1-type ATP synthase delta subunit
MSTKESNYFPAWLEIVLSKNIFVKKDKIFEDIELITDRIFFSYRAGDFKNIEDDKETFSSKIEEIFEDQIEEGTKDFILEIFSLKQFDDFALKSIDFFEYCKGEIYMMEEISVFTAVDISQTSKSEIAKKITAGKGKKWVSYSSDPSMIAGIRIVDGNSQSDYSLRRFLAPVLAQYINNNISR